jgi:hypothetical protein
VRNPPHQLVDALRSTLEEVAHAGLTPSRGRRVTAFRSCARPSWPGWVVARSRARGADQQNAWPAERPTSRTASQPTLVTLQGSPATTRPRRIAGGSSAALWDRLVEPPADRVTDVGPVPTRTRTTTVRAALGCVASTHRADGCSRRRTPMQPSRSHYLPAGVHDRPGRSRVEPARRPTAAEPAAAARTSVVARYARHALVRVHVDACVRSGAPVPCCVPQGLVAPWAWRG